MQRRLVSVQRWRQARVHSRVAALGRGGVGGGGADAIMSKIVFYELFGYLIIEKIYAPFLGSALKWEYNCTYCY